MLQLIAYLFLALCGNNKCPGFCCCCCTREDSNALSTFSNDIYAEMSIEDLKNEYGKTKTEAQDYKIMLEQGMMKGADEVKDAQLFIQRVDMKLRLMKTHLAQKMLQAGIQPESTDTLSNFDQLFNKKKNDASHRIKALYSYDIKDNQTFQKTQKIEKRIRKFYGM